MNFAKNIECKKCKTAKVAPPAPVVVQVVEGNDKNVCCICLDRPLEAYLKNCKHICMCMVCSFTQNKCPKCRVSYNPDKDVEKAFVG